MTTRSARAVRRLRGVPAGVLTAVFAVLCAAVPAASPPPASPSTAPVAATAPATAGRPAADGAGDARDVAADVAPPPQSVERRGADIPLPPRVRVVTGKDTDPAALAALVGALHAEGASADVGGADDRPTGGPLTVWVGGPEENAGSAKVLDALGIDGPRGLPSGGYVLAADRGDASGTGARVVLSGADATGTYYAAQTLRQLIRHRDDAGEQAVLPAVAVRDRPSMSYRGVIEGFYGAPWSQQDRLRQLDFYGAHKMNTYVYAPKDDPYHREQWRKPYPADRLADLRALAERAQRRHVHFVYAVSPGLDVCYSDPQDLAALEAKAASLWDVGVRSFGVFFDDIGRQLTCEQDKRAFGDDRDPPAAAQAHLLNAFQKDFLDQRPGAGRLFTVPTEYSGTGSSAYRERFAELVTAKAVLYWTGPQVVSPAIGADDADAAAAVFRHDLILWDNYPVNDYLPRQLFLGPLTGRSPDLSGHGIVGLTANPMPQAEPSKIALATVADYAWNPSGYDAERSWSSALRDIGGPARESLRTFAGNSRSSDLDRTESPALSARVDRFWDEQGTGTSGPATADLIAEFTAMEHAKGELADHMGNPAFVEQAGPWLTKLHDYGAAGAAATRSLDAQTKGDGAGAWRERVASVRASQAARATYETVAGGVMHRFLDRAAAASHVVTADAPHTAPADQPVTLSADVHAGDLPIKKVEFYAGPRKIAESSTAPYEIRWTSPPTGLHLITAKAVAENGESVTSAPARTTVGDPRPVLLLVGDDAPKPEGASLSTGDAAVRDRLEYLGHPVVVGKGQDSRPEDAQGKAAVVVSSTLSSGSVGTKFRDAGVPVLTWEAYLFDDMGMAKDPGETFRVSSLRIADPASPLAAGLSGTVRVYRGDDRLRWGTAGAHADTAAVMPEEPGHAALFGYREGDDLADGTAAPAPRVALFLGDEGLDPDVVTDDGVRLFDAAVHFALD